MIVRHGALYRHLIRLFMNKAFKNVEPVECCILGATDSDRITCDACGRNILKSEAGLFEGKYYCSHCFRYAAVLYSEGSVFFGSAIACFFSSLFSLFRGLTIFFTSMTSWFPGIRMQGMELLFATATTIGVISLGMSAMFFISGLWLRRASDPRGRNYGLLTAALDFALMMFYMLVLIVFQGAGYIPATNFPLFYTICTHAEAFCDGVLMLILPTLSHVEFIKSK